MQALPPKDAIYLDLNHAIVYAKYKGENAGITEYHRISEGVWCAGWIAFAGSEWDKSFKGRITSWKIESVNPLTLTPSIKCRACGHHGYITKGRWIPA